MGQDQPEKVLKENRLDNDRGILGVVWGCPRGVGTRQNFAEALKHGGEEIKIHLVYKKLGN